MKKIGIFGHVGRGNLGDEALVASMIQAVRERYPDAEIIGFSADPIDTRKRHGIASFPIRNAAHAPRLDVDQSGNGIGTSNRGRGISLKERTKVMLKSVSPVWKFLKRVQGLWGAIRNVPGEIIFLARCYKNLRGTDYLLVAGSQQLIDFIGGPWGHPFTFLKWSTIAHLTHTKLAFVSVGAGPIRHALSKIFIRHSLKRACYRSYRDDISRQLIEQIGFSGPHHVYPDLVCGLRINDLKLRNEPERRMPIVGINPVPYSDPAYWPGSTGRIYEKYIGSLSEFALHLLRKGYEIVFFPTQLRLDPPVIDEIRACIRLRGGKDIERGILEKTVNSFEDLFSCLSMIDLAVASRFHGIIFSYLMRKPVLGIAYHPKTIDLMDQLGQGEYVLDIGKFDVETMITRFSLLESRSKIVKEEIDQRISRCRTLLDDQYALLHRVMEEGWDPLRA